MATEIACGPRGRVVVTVEVVVVAAEVVVTAEVVVEVGETTLAVEAALPPPEVVG